MALAMVSRREIVSGSSLTEVALVGMCGDYMVVNRILIIYGVVIAHRRYRRHFKYGSICLNSGRRLLPSNS